MRRAPHQIIKKTHTDYFTSFHVPYYMVLLHVTSAYHLLYFIHYQTTVA